MLQTDMHHRVFMYVPLFKLVNNMLSVYDVQLGCKCTGVSVRVSFALLLLGNPDLSPAQTVCLPAGGPSVTHVAMATAGSADHTLMCCKTVLLTHGSNTLAFCFHKALVFILPSYTDKNHFVVK